MNDTLFPLDGIRRGAAFSPCGTWRYTLDRDWDASLPGILFVLLNPSTADAEKDDKTNTRGIRFAKAWGFGSCIFVNLFAFRTPKPEVMKAAADPIGPDNDDFILFQARMANVIVVAWGNDGTFMGRDQAVLDLLKEFNLFCMGCTKGGHPKHPLYLRNDIQLEGYRGAHVN